MKQIFRVFTLLSFALSPLSYAQEEKFLEEDVYYTDEDECLFNRGQFVGAENNDWLKSRKREKRKNWTIALGTSALGVATAIFVAKNRSK